MTSAADVRTAIKGVVEAHATYNNWYTAWNQAKDRPSETQFPCVIWGQWQSRIAADPDDVTETMRRIQLVRMMVLTTVPSDRTPELRDDKVEQAEAAATDIILKLQQDYPNVVFGNIAMGTMFDDGTALDTGVLLSFTVKGEHLCLDGDVFNETCPTFEELILLESWATIKPAMTVEQLADATADLGGVSTMYDGVIQLDGVEVDTFGPFDASINNTLTIVLQ